MATGNDAGQWEQVDAARLQIGDEVRIDHRWFDHPFPRRMFRITSERQLAIMRESPPERLFRSCAPAQAQDAAAGDGDGMLSSRAILAAHREALAAAKLRDRVTQERARDMLAMLDVGDPGSADAVVEYLDYLVALLNNSTAPLAPMAPTAWRRSMTRLALLGSDAVWLAGTVGKGMRLDAEALRALATAAAVHMVGLARVAPHLRDEEREDEVARDATLRHYPLLGATILERCGGFAPEVLRIVREHRERPDGSGFPHGLEADAIHPLALILGAVREVQRRSADRSVSPAAALARCYPQLREAYGATIANHLVLALLSMPAGTYVQLSDGSVARILQVNEAARLSPVVEVYGMEGVPAEPRTVDMAATPGLSIVRALDTSYLPPRMFERGRAVKKPSPPPPADPTPASAADAEAAPVADAGA